MASSARGGVAVSPQAHGTRNMETSKLVSCRTRRAPATRQCRRIGEQSKETPRALWSAACLWGWRQKHDGVAVQQAAGSFTWIGVHDPSEEQRLQADHATRMQVSASFKRKTYRCPRPATSVAEKRELRRPVYMDHGDMMCRPILVPRFLQEFDVANAKVGAERNFQKTEVICCVNEMDTAPPEWRIRDVQHMAKVSTLTAGSITLGAAVGPRQKIADQILGKADVIRTPHGRVQLCQDPQTEFALLRESLGVNRVNHILWVRTHTILQEQRAAEIYDEVGKRSLRGSSWSSRRKVRSKRHWVLASPQLASKELETSQLRHIWGLSSQPNRASWP